MKRTVPLLLGVATLWTGPGQLAGAEPSCKEGPPGQVYSFAAPPPVAPVVRAALQAGRAFLRKGEERVAQCADRARGLQSGYVVATLSQGQVSFSAPEMIPHAALSCLTQLAQHLGPVPAPFTRDPGKDLPRDLDVQSVWVLHPPEPGPSPPQAPKVANATRRGFAEIQAEVARHLPGLVSCLAELWEDRPHAAGTLVLRLTLAESGLVDEAEVLRREPSMQAAEPCILRIAGRFRFSPRFGSGRTLMSYPLVLTTGDQSDK